MSRLAYHSLSKGPELRESVPIHISDIDFLYQRNSSQDYNDLPRIKFEKEVCVSFLEDHVYPYWHRPSIFQDVFQHLEIIMPCLDNPNLAKQVQRLATRLALFSKYKPLNGFAIDPREYLRNSLLYGPTFTEWLSKVRAAAIIKSLSSKPLKANQSFVSEKFKDIYGILKIQERYDYDSFLNERFLIDFEETADDLEWAFKPVEEDSDFLYKFRLAARLYLSEHKLKDIKPADRDDFSTWISDSITIDNGGPVINRTLIRERAKKGLLEKDILFNGKVRPLRFKRQVVQVDPGNVRDTWQCNLETLFVIKRVSHLLRQVLDPLPNSAMCRPELLHKKKKLLRKAGNFFMYDIKKCGLTINRNLLLIIGEELEYLYPNKGFIEMKSYGDITVTNGNSDLRPIRGVGMGNCNEGVTLIQCIIGFMVKYQHDIDSLFFNDDGVFYDKEDIRTPFSAILTLYSKLGLIINLEKTIISKFNIFCEEYITNDELDYRKIQLATVPFADVFFKKNICAAKMLYYQLSRGLIGRQVTVDLLDSITCFWGVEFHRMEHYLPYEFGGWRYIGRTSVNEVLRFLFDPRLYLEGEGKSFIAYMREWMGFLVTSKSIKDISIKGNLIPYRTFVPNPFQSWQTSLEDFDDFKEVFENLGIETNKSIRDNLDDLYNYRGSKNAKPKLKAAFLESMSRKRQYVFRQFKRIQGRYLVLDRLPGQLKTALEFLRGEESFPNNYLPPDFMISAFTTIDPSSLKKKGRLLVPNPGEVLGSNDRWGLQCLLRSLYLRQIVKGTNLFALRNQIVLNRERHILSDTVLLDADGYTRPPPWIYLFLPKRDYARLLYILIYNNKQVPVCWEQFPSNREVYDLALNPVKHIFPESDKRFKKILRIGKGFWSHILTCISTVECNTRADFELVLDILEEDIETLQGIDPIHLLTKKEEIIEDELLFVSEENLVEQIVGEKEFNDLLDEFIENEEYEDSSPRFEVETLSYEDEEFDDIKEDLDNDLDDDVLDVEDPDRITVSAFKKAESKNNKDLV